MVSSPVSVEPVKPSSDIYKGEKKATYRFFGFFLVLRRFFDQFFRDRGHFVLAQLPVGALAQFEVELLDVAVDVRKFD